MTTSSRGSCMLNHMKTKLLCVIALSVSLRLFGASPEILTAPPATTSGTNSLKWDSDVKEYAAKLGEANAPFTFIVTNVSKAEVSIEAPQTSCGCTVAKLPSTPYKLQPGSNVAINVSMTLAGKYGLIEKGITVPSSVGNKMLLVRANIPTENKTETK